MRERSGCNANSEQAASIRPLLLIISGPSGVGKGTVCAELLARNADIQFAVSATTRAPRPGEINGVSYYFIDRDEFDRRRTQGDFLEWAEVFGNCYGTMNSEVQRLNAEGKHVLLDIDTQGAGNVKRLRPDAVSVFILPPSLEELERRLCGRGTESDDVRALRLSQAEAEIARSADYDYKIVNEDVSAAVRQIEQIIAVEQSKR